MGEELEVWRSCGRHSIQLKPDEREREKWERERERKNIQAFYKINSGVNNYLTTVLNRVRTSFLENAKQKPIVI
jgi:hypothetical protein